MKTLTLTLIVLLGFPRVALSQERITFTNRDMFNEPGLSYRAYAYVTTSPLEERYEVGSLIGTASDQPQLWDFTQGPTDEILTFEYIDPSGTVFAADFPDATVAESMTSSDGGTDYLFFTPDPQKGRAVHGFYSLSSLVDDPTIIFKDASVDFPNEIEYGDTWTARATFDNSMLGLPARITTDHTFRVDAHGTMVLNDLGFGQCLRVNELSIWTIAIDMSALGVGEAGQFQPLATVNSRNLYWLQPGRGIVAQVSTSAGEGQPPPPDDFNEATAVIHMFETNKAPTAPCTTPEPVTDLSIQYGNGQALLRWSETECAQIYQLEYISELTGGVWTLLQESDQTFYVDQSADAMRLYRVTAARR